MLPSASSKPATNAVLTGVFPAQCPVGKIADGTGFARAKETTKPPKNRRTRPLQADNARKSDTLPAADAANAAWRCLSADWDTAGQTPDVASKARRFAGSARQPVSAEVPASVLAYKKMRPGMRLGICRAAISARVRRSDRPECGSGHQSVRGVMRLKDDIELSRASEPGAARPIRESIA
jgi:hypothetical protein